MDSKITLEITFNNPKNPILKPLSIEELVDSSTDPFGSVDNFNQLLREMYYRSDKLTKTAILQECAKLFYLTREQ
jgi:hypothetical protein